MGGSIVVTGASGFVGRNLVKHAVELGWDVRAVSRKGAAGIPNIFSLGDLTIPHSSRKTIWSSIFAERNGTTPAVVHLAARAHVLREGSCDPLAEFRRANVEAALTVARAAFARGVRRFVFVSSIGVVGARSESPLSELSPCFPKSPYAVSKLEAEAALTLLAADYGAELVILRPPLVYGKGAPGNLKALSRWLARGIPLPLASIQNQRSLIHVRNLCSAILCCVIHGNAPGKIFHVRDPDDYSTPEILRMAAYASGGRARLFSVPDRVLSFSAALLGRRNEFEQLCRSLQVDDALIRRDLGFSPKRLPFEI
jgi:nucleoside-diphosphate-sugar epimerase